MTENTHSQNRPNPLVPQSAPGAPPAFPSRSAHPAPNYGPSAAAFGNPVLTPTSGNTGVGILPPPVPHPAPGARNGVSTVAFVLSLFFFGIGGLLLGFISLHQNHVRGTRGNALSWAAMIIGGVHLATTIVIIFFLVRILAQ